MDWWNIIISLFTGGGIIGLVQLILHFKELESQKPKIECKFDDVFDSFWEHGNQINVNSSDEYLKKVIKYQDIVVLTLDVSNMRKFPVTLAGFYYVNPSDNNKYPAYTNINVEDKSYEIMFFYDENGEHPIIPLITPDINTTFPYKLDGNDMTKVRLVFMLDKLKNLENRKIKLLLKTTLDTFEYEFDIPYSENALLHKKIGYVEAAIIEKNRIIENQRQ